MSKALLRILYDGPSPTARRIDGMRDARGKGIRLSSDRDYVAGYEVAEAMLAQARAEAPRADAARPGVEGAEGRTALVPTGYPAVSSFHS